MKAVFFDLYETLVTHFDPNWVPPLRSTAQRLGIAETTFANSWPQLDRAWQSGEITHYDEALTQLCAIEGKTPEKSVVEELTSEYRARIARLFESVESEVIAMLETLKHSQLKLGLITNASDLDTVPWSSSELAPMFDVVVISHEVGLLKPDKRIYRLACDRLDVEPSDACLLGDGGSDELRGAVEVGLTPFWCTWFLGKWPKGFTPNGFRGGEWRERPFPDPPPFRRLDTPREAVEVLTWM